MVGVGREWTLEGVQQCWQAVLKTSHPPGLLLREAGFPLLRVLMLRQQQLLLPGVAPGLLVGAQS